jgi:oxygen-independent coproporphyrinogen-3 oxidase
MSTLEQRFGTKLKNYCLRMARTYIDEGRLTLDGDTLRLTRSGIFVSDGIMSDMLYIEE